TQEKYPGLPYIILGHSMGSFMLRNYLFRYGSGIQGAVICGTGYVPQPLIVSGLMIAKVQGFLLGDKHVSKLLDKIAFGTYGKRIKNPKTGYDWLAANEETVDKYMKDPMCGFIFTVNGFKTLFTLIARTNHAENLQKMPKELPVLFLSGEEDPVGDYGKGVTKAYGDFEKADMKRIGMKFYAGSRHEIFNEKNREEVCKELYSWILKRVEEHQN
ncbi:MAG: alpha/beta hydrolase, partial [Lachnospiraceae bacterium]|nr:alpha/beta hydrolase [Lachnospiraceae bacterium]